MDEIYKTSWKPRGTMMGVSGKWVNRVEKSGSDHLGRRNWVDHKMIRVISSHRGSQEGATKAG